MMKIKALNVRINIMEEDLERSEERFATTMQKLAEANNNADESKKYLEELENEDGRSAILDEQLIRARITQNS